MLWGGEHSRGTGPRATVYGAKLNNRGETGPTRDIIKKKRKKIAFFIFFVFFLTFS